MRRLLTGECHDENIFELIDPTSYAEGDFEGEVVKALVCLFPDYWCGVFAGAFILEGERRVADLALIQKNLTHWFVVEVELAGQSLEYHILPQVRCFRYGEPDSTCVTSLTRAFKGISRAQALTLLKFIPRYVAVVGNLPDPAWTMALGALDAQYLTVSTYRSRDGRSAHEVEGRLNARSESLGFGRYSAIDNCLLIPRTCGLPVGVLQIVDHFGNSSEWVSRYSAGLLWIQKTYGPALLEHEKYVQIIRMFDGRIYLRPSAG